MDNKPELSQRPLPDERLPGFYKGFIAAAASMVFMLFWSKANPTESLLFDRVMEIGLYAGLIPLAGGALLLGAIRDREAAGKNIDRLLVYRPLLKKVAFFGFGMMMCFLVVHIFGTIAFENPWLREVLGPLFSGSVHAS